MPIYLYENPNNGEVIEIKQSMAEAHEFIDEEGVKWKRVFTNPTASVKDKPIDLRCPNDRELYNSFYKKRYEYNKKKGKIDKT